MFPLRNLDSTMPVGFTKSVREHFLCDNILFSLEFLCDRRALYDNLYPSRIIVGVPVSNKRFEKAVHTFVVFLQQGTLCRASLM